MSELIELAPEQVSETTIQNVLGKHLLLELYECDRDFLDRKDAIQQALVTAAREAGATVIEAVLHRFSPHGISGVVVISESHLTVHTWPEYGYAALDVFTCGDKEILNNIKERLMHAFSAKRSSSKLINRGIGATPVHHA